MADNAISQWIRNLLIVPLIVGLIIAIVAFLLPQLFKDEKEVSYTIEGPTSYLDDPALGSITIEVNEVKIEHLVAYKVRIWNSGDLPLKNLPVRFVFGPKEGLSDFQLFTITHDTTPPYEFGEIRDDRNDANAPRIVYELLNPEDQDIVTLLANKKAEFNVFMKSEGVPVNQVAAAIEKSVWEEYGPIFAAILAAIGSIITAIISLLSQRMQAKKTSQ